MKKKKLPTFVKVIIIVIIAVLLYFPGVILFGTLTDYNPEDIVEINIQNTIEESAPAEITIFDWNIGYAGLGKDEDFFMDGGEKAVPSKEHVEKYLNDISTIINENSADIYLIQEIDINSHRTYNINELNYLGKNNFRDKYNIAYTTNYNVLFVPVPFTNPMGKVDAGLATISRFKISEAKRLKLPGEYSWPTKVFQLDRCILLTRIPVKNNKNLIILNIHPSAYDSGGTLRKQQLDFILKTAEKEYENGNYVIIGGDWNSELTENHFEYTEEKPESYVELPEDKKLNGWKWAVDGSAPTNRSVAFSYEKEKNFVTVIDGYYISPNIEIESVKTLDYQFRASDHNPVLLKIKLK